MNETKTRAEQIAHHESELRRLKAEEDAERGLVEGEPCWDAWPNGEASESRYYDPEKLLPAFPYTDDGKRKAERAALMMSSLNFEDPPFENDCMVYFVHPAGEVCDWRWSGSVADRDAYRQGRIHATEAETLAWRDKFNSAWTGGKS